VALAGLADELDLDRPAMILSLSNLALRIISHKLAPQLHPVPGDGSIRLLFDALRAARNRYNLSISTRMLLLGALSAIVALPRPLAGKLSELLVFPERRQGMTRLVRKTGRQTTSPNRAGVAS
jgi:hypothetical protein